MLADFRHAPQHLPLGDLIHRIDVIDTLLAVPFRLVHSVDANVAGAPFRSRPAALANGHLGRRRFTHHHTATPVSGGLTEVVQVRHRDARESRELGPVKHLPLPLQNLLGRRSAQSPVRLIHAGQQHNIILVIAARELAPPILARAHLPGEEVSPNEACDLRHAQTGHLHEELPQHPSRFLRQPGIVIALQSSTHR